MIRLHIGCGNNFLPGYINIDNDPVLKKIESEREYDFRYVDVDNIDRVFLSESVDEIYAEYFMEHLSHEQIPPTLYKFASVLKLGGILKIVVPDIMSIVNYFLGTNSDEGHYRDWNGLWLMAAEILGPPEEYTRHQSIWSEEIGKQYLESEGLFKVIDIKDVGIRGLGIMFIAKKIENVNYDV